MAKPTLMLTTVGTSLLTNAARGDERSAVYRMANLRAEHLDAEQQRLLEALLTRAAEAIEQGPAAARKASAELNCMLAWCENRESRLAELRHILVATDTATGETAAGLLEDYLRRRGVEHVQVWKPAGLSTGDLGGFRRGVRRLLRHCDEELPGWQALGGRIVFNTLGGFKSQRDVLNVAGMFYADDILYVFEAPGSPLLRIPRLPLRIDEALFRDHARTFLLLAQGMTVGGKTPVPAWLPETLLEEPEAGGERMLSMWGLLVWDRVKDACLPKRPFSLPRLEYTDRFVEEFAALPEDGRRLRTRAHEVLAEVALVLEESGGDTRALSARGGLHYARYSGKNAHLGHFRLSNSEGAYRISCELIGDRLRLRRIGKHDDVNENP